MIMVRFAALVVFDILVVLLLYVIMQGWPARVDSETGIFAPWLYRPTSVVFVILSLPAWLLGYPRWSRVESAVVRNLMFIPLVVGLVLASMAVIAVYLLIVAAL
jgi:hypothetical protein